MGWRHSNHPTKNSTHICIAVKQGFFSEHAKGNYFVGIENVI
jgi:hypothetical protein